MATWSVNLSNTKSKLVERDFPHIVETAVPIHSLSEGLDAIYGFHRRHGIAPRIGQEWMDGHGRNRIRWCFSVPTIAAHFKNEFGAR